MRTESEVRSQIAECGSDGHGHVELYYWQGAPEDGRLAITGPEARHIARVMRHRPGDRVRLTDGRGTQLDVELDEVKSDRVTGKVLGSRRGAREPRHRLAIAQAVLKGDRLAQVCEQVTELGVAELIPLNTRRTVSSLSSSRLVRLQTVALAGLKSSTRTVLPVVGVPVGLEELAVRAREFDQALVAYEEETGPGLAQVLNRAAGSVLLVVGPEGGFEPEEIAALNAAGVVSFSLGPRRLRAETAAVAVAAMALGLLGDLG